MNGETTSIYSFNGLSEWQHFNGLTMNSGCGVNGQIEAKEYQYRESKNVSH
jgi:hypothetical protein